YSFPWIPERNWEFTDLDEDEAKERTGGRLPKFLPRSDETPEDAELNEKDGEKILQMVLDAAGAAGVVAEDLGMVPPYVRPLLKKLGIPGFAIPIFERNEEDRSFKQPDELAPLSLATYGTHDHDPLKTYYENLVEWWHGPDGHEGWREVQRLMRFLGGDENNPPASFSRDLHFLFLEVLLNTPCWLTLLMITDLLGTSQRFNEPGIAGEYNWSQRLERTLDEYEKSSDFGDVISYFAKLIEKTGRQPSKMPAGTARQTK
ncbi:MAG TPA: 4-alpha-glucanotransferase, partial [Candidatus Obscuribacterales bacterium]